MNKVAVVYWSGTGNTQAMAEAEELYTQQNPNVTFADTQYEASGTLNEMLGAGQYADILITASKGTMDDAAENGYVKEDTRQTMFNNDLVIVTKEGGDLAGWDISLEDIAAGKYTLAVGDETVPAGNYACQSLTTVGSYIEPDGATGADATGKGGEFSATLQPKVTLGGKVGDVCKYAESGEVDIAMVYTSDVYRMGGVAICSVVPCVLDLFLGVWGIGAANRPARAYATMYVGVTLLALVLNAVAVMVYVLLNGFVWPAIVNLVIVAVYYYFSRAVRFEALK